MFVQFRVTVLYKITVYLPPYSRLDGLVNFEEVVRAFAKTFSIDVAGISQLRDSLREVWCVFDMDNSGAIDRREFMHPNDGLADTVLATMRFL